MGTAPAQRRGFVRQYPIQKESFSPIPHKSAMAGISLAIALFLVLDEKSLLLKCFAVLLHGFFLVTRNRHAEILCVFQGAILRLQGKRPGQNRIMSYEAPPLGTLFGHFMNGSMVSPSFGFTAELAQIALQTNSSSVSTTRFSSFTLQTRPEISTSPSVHALMSALPAKFAILTFSSTIFL